ncbi:cardiolipin synthase ClsB [Halopseudomonas salina]|uniref:Cardiolipin synthase B n=1 Tax=Halopseudomonas salina TaxID=1323744 RepID=A0ABQ1NX19_9GAMM|nr:cardiolipin synthase ClsB [Halopseudomonas salina]GGC86759.1 cardiolipin synthase B [Halopseudomonas salina]
MKAHWCDGNQVELLINGEAFFPSVFERVRAAREEILLETFILFEDKVGRELQQVLIEAAKRGVRIEVLVDGYGTADLSTPFVKEMTEVGISVHMFDPQPKLLGYRTNLFRRLHRKIVVIDCQEAFVGGINFSVDHLAESGPMAKQDYAVLVRGPIVADIHRASMDLFHRTRNSAPDWTDRSEHKVQRRAGGASMLLSIRDNDHHLRDIEAQYMRAIRSADHRLVIANAYFFPGYRLMRALRVAAKRGVNVVLILQGQPDMPWVRLASQFLYGYLLRSGVKVYEYCERPLHGKVALVDREWCTVGSSNLDPLSLSLNLEANLMIRDHALNQQLFEHLNRLADAKCNEITLEEVNRGAWWKTPVSVLCFHFLRHFPAMAGMLPAHTPRLEPLTPGAEEAEMMELNQDKPS